MALRSEVATDIFQTHFYVMQLLELMVTSILGYLGHDRCRESISSQVWMSCHFWLPRVPYASPPLTLSQYIAMSSSYLNPTQLPWQDCLSCSLFYLHCMLGMCVVLTKYLLRGWISESIIVSVDARDTIYFQKYCFYSGFTHSLCVH